MLDMRKLVAAVAKAKSAPLMMKPKAAEEIADECLNLLGTIALEFEDMRKRLERLEAGR